MGIQYGTTIEGDLEVTAVTRLHRLLPLEPSVKSKIISTLDIPRAYLLASTYGIVLPRQELLCPAKFERACVLMLKYL